MTPATSFASPQPGRVDRFLVNVRWLLAILVLPVAWVDSGGIEFSRALLIWLGAFVLYNLLIWLFLRLRFLTARLPVATLVADFIFFFVLPLLNPSGGSLFLFALFPTVVAALRFGPYVGALMAGLLALPFELRALLYLLPTSVRQAIPFSLDPVVSPLSAGLPAAALFAVVILAGFVAQHEKEAVLGTAGVELTELRRALAGAKLFYQTADTLSATLNYSHVLEAMLDAGIAGLPEARREDGPPVGIALFFDESNEEKPLRVVAQRHLDRTDRQKVVPGKNGIIAQTLREAESVVFANVSQDPELATFAALRRCRAGVCFPLQSGLDLHGVVVLATPSPRKPSPRHLELMRAFTNQAAIAFQNTRLYADLRAERDRIVDSDTQARTKLARNLHDGPAQAVSSIAMRLEFAHRLIDADPAQAKSEIDAIREAALKTSKDIRNLLFTLRPLALESNGLSAALNQLAQRLRETDRLPLTMDAGNIGPDLDITVAETVFAIIEEAITNARKHAKNSPIYVRVGQQDGTLVVLVQDQGPGFDVKEVEENYAQRGSLGLANMRERAAVIGGNLLIDSEPGRGTRITLAVPWPEKVSG